MALTLQPAFERAIISSVRAGDFAAQLDFGFPNLAASSVDREADRAKRRDRRADAAHQRCGIVPVRLSIACLPSMNGRMAKTFGRNYSIMQMRPVALLVSFSLGGLLESFAVFEL